MIFYTRLSRVLVTPNNNQIGMANACSQKKNLQPILTMMEKCVDNLTPEQLIALGEQLRAALYDPNSEYRGLCCSREEVNI